MILAMNLSAETKLTNVLQQCAQWLHQMISSDNRIQQGAERLTDSLSRVRAKSYTATTLPVLDSLPQANDTPLAQQLQCIAHELLWIPSPRSSDQGSQMALCPINKMLDLGDVVAGLLYLDSGYSYPEHQHPPQELYLILSGHADWRYGGSSGYVPVAPGKALYNHPMVLHGIKAGATPLLALYVLW